MQQSFQTRIDANDARQNMGKVRVLLADANRAILSCVRNLLCEEFEIVGAVNNGRDAIAKVQRLDPDVLVIAISQPMLDGLEVASRLGVDRRTRVVFLTIEEDCDFVEAALATGASGYVAKSALITDLAPAIHAAFEGRRFLSKSLQR